MQIYKLNAPQYAHPLAQKTQPAFKMTIYQITNVSAEFAKPNIPLKQNRISVYPNWRVNH